MQGLKRKNSFDDYGAEPSPLAWEKIENQLPAPRGKKRGWLIWSIAAVLIAGVFLSAYLLDVEIKLKPKGATENSSTAHKDETNSGMKKNITEKNQSQITEHLKANTKAVEKISSVHIASSQLAEINKKEKNKIVSAEPVTESVKEKTTEENEAVLTENIVVPPAELAADKRAFIENIPSIMVTKIQTPDIQLALRTPFTDFQPMKKKPSVSRWQFALSGGGNYNYRTLNFSSSVNSNISEGEKKYLAENEKGIQTFSFETGIGYSLSTHFNLNFGINYFTAGQERNQSEIIFSSGTAGTPNRLYTVNTSAGALSANGQQVDNAYYNNTDSTLFTSNSSLIGSPLPQDSSTTKDFILRQEFSFIGFPLLIQYQPAEHRVTPYIGFGFSAGYILKEKVTFNDKAVDYNYRQSTNTILFFAEAQAGVKYRVSNNLFLKLQPSLRYGLNSLNGDDTIKWIPYSAGIGAGINFRF